MRILTALGFALLFALPRLAGAAALDEAKKKLEAARANLNKAVERAQKDPPSAADLDAAMNAVAALKATIDSGAEFEPLDLDYAKAALAARKELRTHREYVEARRAKVHIHNSWRDIERAIAKLNESASDAAVAELEKLIAAAEQFAAQDQKFAAFLLEARSAISRHQIEKQKASIAGGRRMLDAAMTPLVGKNTTEAQFEAAERAAETLSKYIEDGKTLEAKDSAYKDYAEQARSDVKIARGRIDALWSETGLARLKAELEPVRADLLQAAKALREKKPSKEQLDEARTVSIVVGKLLEKSRGMTSRSAPAAAYVAEVKKSLVEVEVSLQKRSLEAARDAVNAAMRAAREKNAAEETFKAAEDALKEAEAVLAAGARLEREDRGYGSFAAQTRREFRDASSSVTTRRTEIDVERQRSAVDAARADLIRSLKNLERRSPSDDHFAEANTAAIVLEKTLETATAKDSELQKYVRDMRGVVKESKATIGKRKLEVDIERLRADVERGRSEIGRLMNRIWGKIPDERLQDVEKEIERVRGLLSQGTGLSERDRAFQTYEREVKKRLEETTSRIAIRRDELAVEAQKSLVEPAMKELTKTVAAIDGFGEKASLIAIAERALEEANTAIGAGAALEKKISSYASWAKQQKSSLEWHRQRIAKKKLELTAGDNRALVDELVQAAKAAIELAKEPDANDQHVSSAAAAVKAVKDAIERNLALEEKEKSYANFAARVRRDLERFDADVEAAKVARAFRKATLELLISGIAAASNAVKVAELRGQKAAYDKAMADFRSCELGGERMLGDNEAVATVRVVMEGQKHAPKEVIAMCKERAVSTEAELKHVLGLIAFEDGPKKTYEAGRRLLQNAQKNEALAQFEECMSSGKILQYKNPELKDRKFEVAGAQMTLSEVIAACTAETKKIRGK